MINSLSDGIPLTLKVKIPPVPLTVNTVIKQSLIMFAPPKNLPRTLRLSPGA